MVHSQQRLRFLLAFLVLFTRWVTSDAQTSLGSWNILNGRYNLNDRWNVFAEGQIRSLRFYNHFHYYEFKGGLGFKINDQLGAVAGIGRYDTYSEGGNFLNPRQNNELRTWAQLNMKNRGGRFYFEHRYRAEQRFTQSGYRNRFRYRLMLTVPLNRDKLETGAIYSSVWTEVFLTNQAPYFERLRSFVGFGWEVADKVAIQCGYVYQFDYRLTDETGRQFLQIGVYFELDRSTRGERAVPGTND